METVTVILAPNFDNIDNNNNDNNNEQPNIIIEPLIITKHEPNMQLHVTDL